MRNLMGTLLLSAGVPMITAGDEFGRSQRGNNNAYCQDSELSWINWDLTTDDRELIRFVQTVIRLRKRHPTLHRSAFFQGRRIQGTSAKDITWLRPDGKEMTDAEWQQSFARALGMLFVGEAIDERDERGRRLKDDNLLLLLNAHHEEIRFIIPSAPPKARWNVLVDTSYPEGKRLDGRYFYSEGSYPLQSRSLALLVQQKSPPPSGAHHAAPP
jgi:glycogen operon protein